MSRTLHFITPMGDIACGKPAKRGAWTRERTEATCRQCIEYILRLEYTERRQDRERATKGD